MFSGSSKPTFGTPTNTGFGFNSSQPQQQQASPFGNSFARTTTGFGQPQQQNTSLFGAQPQATGGMFGGASAAPAFGQTQTAPQTGFSGKINPFPTFHSPLLIMPSPGFQPQTNTSVFGANTATQNTSLFGQAGTTAFGAAKPAGTTGFGGFSATPQQQPTSSIFGQPATAGTATGSFFGQQAAPSTSLFGAPAAANAFGATTVTPLGGAAPGATGNGTAMAKYQPLIGTDTLMKNNQQQSVTTNQHCITAMKEYENSSLEELRFEDYAANRKGPQAGATPGGGLFGTPGTSTTGMFGSPATQQTSAFGQTENKGLFGQPTNTLGGFGQTQSSFGAAAPQNNSMFKGFGTPATSAPAFGFNNTATNNSANSMFKGFGAPAATSTGLFGNNPATGQSVFGQPAVSAAPSFGSTFGQPNATAAAPSLFGAPADNKPAFGQPAPSTGFSFGQPAATGGTGLFGQAKPPENTFAAPAFGATTSQAAPVFGAAQPTQSLFGNNTFGAKPAAAPFTGFGQQQTTAPLGGGMLGQTQGGLFGGGMAAQKPGGLFGAPATNTAQPGSLFGGFNTGATGTSTLGQTSMGMGAFGQPAQQQQAQVPIHQQILDMTANPYGDNPIFKDLKPVSSEDTLRPTNPTAQKAVLESNAMQFKVSSKVGGGVKVKPIGSVGSRNSMFDGLEEYDKSVDTFSMKPSARRLNIRTKTISSSQEQLNSSRTFVLNGSNSDVGGMTTTPRRGANRTDEESFSNNANLTPRDRPEAGNETPGRDSWIQSNALEKARIATAGRNTETAALSSTIHELVPERTNRSSLPAGNALDSSMGLNVSAKLADVSQRSAATYASQSSSLDNSLASRTFNPDETNVELIDPSSVHPTGITLKRAGYYTMPSLDELCSYLSEDGSCWVNNFTIGREGYGNVYFSERMDVANLNLDEVVFFRNKEVIIYPIDEQKPPVGQGLNRKAQITLDQVWPTDKTSHEAIKDPERLSAMDYEAKLRRACYKHETRFIDYRPETGSWVFRVDHFSKYGLSDSDDEADDDVQGPKKPKMGVQQGELKRPEAQNQKLVGVKPPQQQQQITERGAATGNRTLEELDMEDDHFDGEYTYRSRRPTEVTSPSSAVASGYGVDAHKLQLMKASFFIDDNELAAEEEEGDTDGEQSQHQPHTMMNMFRGHLDQTVPNRHFSQYSSSMQSLAESGTHRTNPAARETFVDGDTSYRAPVPPQPVIETAPPLVIRPKVFEVRTSVVVLPEQMSQVMGKADESCFADLSFLFGRKFKIGFGGRNQMTFVSNGRDSELLLKQGKVSMTLATRIFQGRSGNNFSGPVVANVQVSARNHIRDFAQTVEEHLKIQLNFSSASQVVDGQCPLMTVAGGTTLLLSHFELASAQAERMDDEYQQYVRTVWALCMSLWGDDECLEGPEAGGHLSMMRRRELVSGWLEEVVVAQRRAIKVSAKEDYLAHLLELLLSHKVVEACELALGNDDVNLALLLSQISGGQVVRQLIQHQLSCWQEVEADAFIDANRLKAYMLVAGTPLLTSTHGLINVFSDVDWVTGLAIHLWYLCSPTLSVTDALVNYEQDFLHVDEIVAAPSPPYASEYRIQSGNPIQDIRFHLLKLYSKRSHRLEALLNPATHTADPMDFRLSWFLLQTLKTLGYRHCSPLSEAQLTTSFAEQLELHDLWQWAVFVMMHLEGEGRREATIRHILNRSIRLNGEKECTRQYQEKEAFVMQELKVPKKWVYAAKAMRAGVFDRHHDQVKFYLKAQEWSSAHEILMEKIAPDCIINGECGGVTWFNIIQTDLFSSIMWLADDMEYLSSILKEFVDPIKRVLSWRNQGQILVDYITLTGKVRGHCQRLGNI